MQILKSLKEISDKVEPAKSWRDLSIGAEAKASMVHIMHRRGRFFRGSALVEGKLERVSFSGEIESLLEWWLNGVNPSTGKVNNWLDFCVKPEKIRVSEAGGKKILELVEAPSLYDPNLPYIPFGVFKKTASRSMPEVVEGKLFLKETPQWELERWGGALFPHRGLKQGNLEELLNQLLTLDPNVLKLGYAIEHGNLDVAEQRVLNLFDSAIESGLLLPGNPEEEELFVEYLLDEFKK